VLDQDYPSIEVVVVDDGSTSETADMLDWLCSADDRIVVLRNDEAQGASAARNAGMASSSGELISFCDDDDVWLPGAAGAAVGALDPAIGMVYGHHQVLFEDTGRLVTFRPPAVANAALMRWINAPAILFAVARRANVDAELRFDTELITSEDWDMWLRCAERAPMSMVPTPLYRYVQHKDDRVTSTLSAYAEGHRRFLTKHRSSMTPACIAHHELAIALTTHDRNAAVGQIGLVPRHPANLGSAAVLVGELVASRMGQRREDPGLPLRLAARALAHATGTGNGVGKVT
jgi:glycosyltransferase involved in cell wall biosynthesis